MLIYLHMVHRQFWQRKIREAWRRRSVVWLSGVRRVGKTVLCRSIAGVEVLDCELPSIRKQLEDPEAFLEGHSGKRIVLDEIHRLPDAAQILKIAADHYPQTKVLATGSSTLGASTRFKDTLTGRKTEVWLTPMISEDLIDFENQDLKHRLLHGGLPPFFLEAKTPEKEFQEWMDAYWAKDIQELFRLERKYSFQKLTELILAQSGGIFDASRFSVLCEVSRGTVQNYLSVLEATFVVHVLRPFHSHKSSEIVHAPKVYGFDTGFVCYYRGWYSLRTDDLGALWEHFVLNEIQARLQTRRVHYWRDKRGHEVDFVLSPRGEKPILVEAKWSDSDFDPASFQSFRHLYPGTRNLVVCSNIKESYRRKFSAVMVQFVSLQHLLKLLSPYRTKLG